MPLKRISDLTEGPPAAKASSLLDKLAALESILVAFSGGVDSSLLLAAAHEACGDRSVAVTVSSALFPRRTVEYARRIADLIGCRHRIVKIKVLESPVISRNATDRCYQCKREIFVRLRSMAGEEGVRAIVEGSNVDDLSDFRPGEKALMELGIVSPLRQADLTKADVRYLSKLIGLPGWDRPADACLASRFPYGKEITRDALARVERLEDELVKMGFRQVRARYHGDLARIEVEPEKVSLALEPGLRDKIIQMTRREGFRFVTLDLQGYRMGSLNP